MRKAIRKSVELVAECFQLRDRSSRPGFVPLPSTRGSRDLRPRLPRPGIHRLRHPRRPWRGSHRERRGTHIRRWIRGHGRPARDSRAPSRSGCGGRRSAPRVARGRLARRECPLRVPAARVSDGLLALHLEWRTHDAGRVSASHRVRARAAPEKPAFVFAVAAKSGAADFEARARRFETRVAETFAASRLRGAKSELVSRARDFFGSSLGRAELGAAFFRPDESAGYRRSAACRCPPHREASLKEPDPRAGRP